MYLYIFVRIFFQSKNMFKPEKKSGEGFINKLLLSTRSICTDYVYVLCELNRK